MSKKLQQISVPLISVFLGILLGARGRWMFGYGAIWGDEELFQVVNFWRDKGVKGFRFDVINLIGKDEVLVDCHRQLVTLWR